MCFPGGEVGGTPPINPNDPPSVSVPVGGGPGGGGGPSASGSAISSLLGLGGQFAGMMGGGAAKEKRPLGGMNGFDDPSDALNLIAESDPEYLLQLARLSQPPAIRMFG